MSFLSAITSPVLDAFGLSALDAQKQKQKAQQRYGQGMKAGQEQKVANLPAIQRSRLLGTSTLGDNAQSY